MAYTVVIPQDITEPGKAFLRDKGYAVVVGSGGVEPEDIKRAIAPADAILARTAPFTREILAAAPSLKVIARHGIGVDNIDVDYCTERGVWVTFAPRSNAVSVAEHAIGFLVAAAHRFSLMDRAARRGDWSVRNTATCVDLEGKTLGVVGLGRIGGMVAKKAGAAFGMKILGHDPFVKPGDFPPGVSPAGLEELFAESDFVSLHAPSTPETRGMVGAAVLARMKPTAYLVNCARGGLVDEQALYEALKNNRLAGAALDVFEREPADPKNPLFTLENVELTPHSAALTSESLDRMGLHAAMGIHSALSGERPEWAVNSI
ncbi:MAG: hydroxyacid dehydrogenase [Planctomycetota bacterium]|jgi:D-3-phosphoglycerate dehydrogenase|nr:hydroxyacid dehydrogenase [Planctomycetota bacterium]